MPHIHRSVARGLVGEALGTADHRAARRGGTVSEAIARLERWKNGHKNRAVEIIHDNGYGASCWIVTLMVGQKETVACGWSEEKGDWIGLEETINNALDALGA